MSFMRVHTPIMRPPFVVDQGSIVRDTGRQIEWDALDSRYDHGAALVVLTESVDVDETAITVNALTKPIPAGTILDFGDLAAIIVTLTADKAIGQVSLAVLALTGALRAGTILNFGVGKQARITADAAVGAVAVTVEALDTALTNGNTATIPATRKTLRLSAPALVGALSITVDGADMALEIGDFAFFGGDHIEAGRGRYIYPGTVVDLLPNGRVVPSAMNGAGLTAYGILETGADEDSRTDAITGYGVICAGYLYENLLPEEAIGVINTTWKTELRARGGSWMFTQYQDTTAL